MGDTFKLGGLGGIARPSPEGVNYLHLARAELDSAEEPVGVPALGRLEVWFGSNRDE
jgi:hypothetical protein